MKVVQLRELVGLFGYSRERSLRDRLQVLATRDSTWNVELVRSPAGRITALTVSGVRRFAREKYLRHEPNAPLPEVVDACCARAVEDGEVPAPTESAPVIPGLGVPALPAGVVATPAESASPGVLLAQAELLERAAKAALDAGLLTQQTYAEALSRALRWATGRTDLLELPALPSGQEVVPKAASWVLSRYTLPPWSSATEVAYWVGHGCTVADVSRAARALRLESGHADVMERRIAGRGSEKPVDQRLYAPSAVRALIGEILRDPSERMRAKLKVAGLVE